MILKSKITLAASILGFIFVMLSMPKEVMGTTFMMFVCLFFVLVIIFVAILLIVGLGGKR
jgi:hypothetical protein